MTDLKTTLEFTQDKGVLFVEDDPEVRELMVKTLEDLFANVYTAVDGEDGLEKFYANSIDVVISDVNLPNMNGLEMSKRLRDFDKDLPIIILSGHNESKYIYDSIDLNIDSYLLKPLSLDDLNKALRRVAKRVEFLNEYKNNLLFLQQYQELTDLSAAVSKTDTDGRITYVNDEFCKLSGYSKEELLGSKHNIVRHPENEPTMYADIWHALGIDKRAWKGVIRNASKDYETYYVDTIIKPILNANNEIIEYISIQKDVTDLLNPKKQLHDYVDSSQEPLVAFVKIDGFMDIEKLYGHKITQEIEDKFADKILEQMPEYLHFKKFFSLGHGEYIFVQDLELNTELELDTIILELKNFQQMVSGLEIDIGEIEYDISILMSVSHGEHCLENVKYAMKSLERTKQDFIVSNDFVEQEQGKALQNLQILKMVKVAIDNMNIISYFQPIVSNETKKVVKYESLVRLVNEDGKVVSPYLFLDLAKRGKYYSKITGMVLENSFNALKFTDKSVTMNISALDIEKKSTREKIYELLDLHREMGPRIVFELLEDEDVRDFDEITKFIARVKAFGVKIAIDDFGAGYSNFERLLKYQPDILKIDGSLIKNIETDAYSMSVVKTIVAFAKEQKIEMVAEYIENENIYEIIRSLGVEYSQGYYFGAPALLN